MGFEPIPGDPMVADRSEAGFTQDDADCGLQAGWTLVTRDGAYYNVPVTMEGQVVTGHIASDDLPHNHGTKDQYFFVHLDPQYRWLLSKDGNFETGAGVEHGRLEVEWEMQGDPSVYEPYAIGFPPWALPQQGDRVFVVGSHIFDCGHSPHRTEIHPPRLVVTYRNAAQDNFAGASNRIGSWFCFPENDGIPTLATRADVYASTYGGEAVEESYDNEDVNLSEKYPHDMGPVGNEQTWWQPIQDRDYTFTIKAPPNPGGGTLIHHIEDHKPSVTCVSVKPLLTPLPTGDGYSVTLPLSEVPLDVLYVRVGITIYVGWDLPDPVPAAANVRHYRVDLKNIHIFDPLDDISGTGEISINACINDESVRLLSGDHTDSMGETYRSVSSGGDLTPGDLDKSVFFVSLVDGQPLRLSFRGVDYDPTENNELGTAEVILTGDDSDWTDVDRTVAATNHGVMGEEDCHDDCLAAGTGCFNVTYRITRLHAPHAELTVLPPKVVTAETTWVTSETPMMILTDHVGPPGGSITSFYCYHRAGQPRPAATECATEPQVCGLKINSNDGADGAYVLDYWCMDSETKAVEIPQRVSISLDNTPPVTSASLEGTLTRGWYRTPVVVSLKATDGSGVGVKSTTYSFGGAVDTPYAQSVTVSAEGANHVFAYRSVDELSNTEALKTLMFKIDRTPPLLSVAGAHDGTFTYTEEEVKAGVFTNSTTLTLDYSASDALSGIHQVRLDGAAVASPAVATLAAGISTHLLEAEDVAGNTQSITFPVVSIPPGTFPGGVDPKPPAFWKTAVTSGAYTSQAIADFLTMANLVSQAFGPVLNRWAHATLDNHDDYLGPTPGDDVDARVRAELLATWLNLVSGREPTTAPITLQVPGWQTVVKNTGASNQTTALNVVREVERRLGEAPSSDLLKTIRAVLQKLHTGNV